MLSLVTNAIEFLALTFAFFLLRKDPNFIWKGFIYYLLFVCLIEAGGFLLHRYRHGNSWLYNIYILVEAGFNSYIFLKFFNKYKPSKIWFGSGLALLALIYLYDFADHGFGIFNTLTTTVMSVLFVIYGIYYYYLLLRADEYVELKTHPPFWWVTGTVFFYFGSSVCNLVFLLIWTQPLSYRFYIYMGLVALLYGFWTYSFLCRYRQTRQRLS